MREVPLREGEGERESREREGERVRGREREWERGREGEREARLPHLGKRCPQAPTLKALAAASPQFFLMAVRISDPNQYLWIGFPPLRAALYFLYTSASSAANAATRPFLRRLHCTAGSSRSFIEI